MEDSKASTSACSLEIEVGNFLDPPHLLGKKQTVHNTGTVINVIIMIWTQLKCIILPNIYNIFVNWTNAIKIYYIVYCIRVLFSKSLFFILLKWSQTRYFSIIPVLSIGRWQVFFMNNSSFPPKTLNLSMASNSNVYGYQTTYPSSVIY